MHIWPKVYLYSTVSEKMSTQCIYSVYMICSVYDIYRQSRYTLKADEYIVIGKSIMARPVWTFPQRAIQSLPNGLRS